jgi:hypothetical protein
MRSISQPSRILFRDRAADSRHQFRKFGGENINQFA